MIVNLCGAGSSGSSFLAQMLDRHPAVACGDELYLFNKPLLYRNFARFRRCGPLIRRLGLSGNPHHPNRTLFHELAAYGLEANRVWGWVRHSADIRALAGRFQDHVRVLTGKPVWVEKTPSNSRTLGLFLAAFPDARAVHLVRDPRDQALSLMRRGNSLEVAAQIWLTAVAAISPLRGRANLLEVRYEDLVTDFPGQMTRICAFLGTDFDPAYFACDTYASRGLSRAPGHPSWRADPGAGPSRVSLGRYREADLSFAPLLNARLTPDYAAILGTPRLAVHELMTHYGYAYQTAEVGPDAGRFVADPRRPGRRRLLERLVDGAGPLPRIVV